MKQTVECKSLPVCLPEDLAKEVDDIYGSLPKECQTMKRKAYNVDFQFEPGERAEVSILSTPCVDLEREVIVAKGIDLEGYRRHMTVLWNHDRNKPVATCQWIKLQADKLRGKTLYPEDVSEFTDNIWSLTKGGLIKAKSVSVLPTEPGSEATEEELQANPEWADAIIYRKSIMLEYSCCTLGMNTESLVEAVNNKSASLAQLHALGINVTMPAVVKAAEKVDESKPNELAALAFVVDLLNRKRKTATPQQIARQLEKAICKALDSIDPEEIVMLAKQERNNRGRV